MFGKVRVTQILQETLAFGGVGHNLDALVEENVLVCRRQTHRLNLLSLLQNQLDLFVRRLVRQVHKIVVKISQVEISQVDSEVGSADCANKL